MEVIESLEGLVKSPVSYIESLTIGTVSTVKYLDDRDISHSLKVYENILNLNLSDYIHTDQGYSCKLIDSPWFVAYVYVSTNLGIEGLTHISFDEDGKVDIR